MGRETERKEKVSVREEREKRKEKKRDICDFNVKMTASQPTQWWQTLLEAFFKLHGNLVLLRAFMKFICQMVFGSYKIECQQHTKDACDVCVTFWKMKHSFLQ